MNYNVKARVKPDSADVNTADTKMSMSLFDEVAVEETVCLKEKGVATEVVTIPCGVARCQETLRTAMAIGADRSILVETGAELQPLAVVKLLKILASRKQPTPIPLNKQTVDDDTSQAGQMLATLAGLPQATCTSKIGVIGGKITVTREVDDGLETVSLTLPAAITTDLCLNESRYATLPNIMKAKKEPLDIVRPEDLGVDVASHLKTLKVSEPPKRSTDVMVADVTTLVGKLKSEAKVI